MHELHECRLIVNVLALSNSPNGLQRHSFNSRYSCSKQIPVAYPCVCSFFEHEYHELHECRLIVNALGVIEFPECLQRHSFNSCYSCSKQICPIPFVCIFDETFVRHVDARLVRQDFPIPIILESLNIVLCNLFFAFISVLFFEKSDGYLIYLHYLCKQTNLY